MAQEISLNQIDLITEPSSDTNLVCERGRGMEKVSIKEFK